MKTNNINALYRNTVLIFSVFTFLNSNATPKKWNGGGGDNNWSTGANWTGSSAPTSTDTVIFDGTSSKNCTIDVNPTVLKIEINSGYTGTINGGSTTITDNGAFTIADGTFISTSGTMTIKGDFTNSGGTFTHNNGTVVFSTNSLTIGGSNTTFNNLTFTNTSSNTTFTISTGITLTVEGNLLESGSQNLYINTGTIEVKGHITLSNNGTGGGDAWIKAIGTADQTLTGSGYINRSPLVNFEINKPSGGTLTLSDTILVMGDWKHTAGTVSTGTSNVIFSSQGTPSTFNITCLSGGSTFYDVEFYGFWSCTMDITNTMIVSHTFYMTGGQNINMTHGIIEAKGNVTITNTGNGNIATLSSPTTLKINGTGPQTITGPAAINQGKLPILLINKPTNTLTFSGIISTALNITIDSLNTPTVTGSTLAFTNAGNSVTFKAKNMTVPLNNLTMNAALGTINIGAASYATQINTAGTYKATQGTTVVVYNAANNGIN